MRSPFEKGTGGLTGSMAEVVSGKSAVERELDRMFVARLRGSLWVIFLSILVFAAVSQTFMNEPLAVRLIRLFQAAVVGTAIFSLDYRRVKRHPTTVAFTTVTVVSITTILAATLANAQSEAMSLLAFVVLVLGSATLFPWGVRYQLATGLLTSISMLASLMVGDAPSGGSSGLATMLAICTALSLYVSHEIRRTHQLIAERNMQHEDDDHALRDAEARARAIVNTAAEGIVTFDESGIVISFNPAAEPLFGLAAEEVVGKHVETIMPGLLPRRGAAKPEVSRTCREIAGLRMDGTSFPLEVTVSELHLAEHTMFTAIARDASDRKRVEELLESRAREHAAALESQTLFLAASSHDVRNSLAVIAGLADLMNDDEDALPVAEATHRIKHLAITLADIMTELLQYATMDRAGGVVPSEGCAKRLLSETVEAYREACREKGLQLELQLPEAAPLFTDLTKVRRILHNLLSNAVRYTLAGSIHVAGALTANELEIRVRDTGIGMSAGDLESVFEPFSRLPAARQIEPLGTGLGLATVQSLCDQLQGSVSIESAVGVGSTFTVRLPRRIIAAAA